MIVLSGHPCLTPAVILISAVGPVLLRMVIMLLLCK
jgi:hypothetical protein